MLGKCVILAFMLMVVSNFAIAEQSDAIGGVSFGPFVNIPKTSSIDNENVSLELMHRGRPDVKGVIRYTLGARTNYDRLVASGVQNNTWPTPHDVSVQLNYPQQGAGATVTYVEVSVDQTSNLGRAYVVKGGINQHFITVVIEAYDTLVFNINASVFGV